MRQCLKMSQASKIFSAVNNAWATRKRVLTTFKYIKVSSEWQKQCVPWQPVARWKEFRHKSAQALQHFTRCCKYPPLSWYVLYSMASMGSGTLLDLGIFCQEDLGMQLWDRCKPTRRLACRLEIGICRDMQGMVEWCRMCCSDQFESSCPTTCGPRDTRDRTCCCNLAPLLCVNQPPSYLFYSSPQWWFSSAHEISWCFTIRQPLSSMRSVWKNRFVDLPRPGCSKTATRGLMWRGIV